MRAAGVHREVDDRARVEDREAVVGDRPPPRRPAGDDRPVRRDVDHVDSVDAERTSQFAAYGDSGAGWTGGDSTYSLVLEDGRVVGRGTHEELLRECGTYQEIVASQLSTEDAA